MSNIKPHFLTIIHETLLSRSRHFKYNQIPTTLPSSLCSSPSKYELQKDLSTLTKHFRHPIFVNFVPNYTPIEENYYTDWLNLYINRNNR